MKHLIVSREYPPGAYPPGGIGAYVANIARLLAERGETVHVIGERWTGAPKRQEVLYGGKLIVHRIGEDDIPESATAGDGARMAQEHAGLRLSEFPAQWFAWHAALLAEQLIDREGIDVVEGQDWEAPLYHLLLRRSIGIGSPNQPPCIVHLHSSSSVIRRYNGALGVPEHYSSLKRMEEFTIKAADALLCPSHYFARQCEHQFNLEPGRINVIHLPVGNIPQMERAPEIWDRGGICFVGRLEPRKGIIEWVEAATRVAHEDPDVSFDFVGADIWGLQQNFLRRMPRQLRPRFRFHGSANRDEVQKFLAGARSAVVPSRWENFPNVCIEAMSSGLPVIATRLGGMVELIEDGRSGWLTPDTGISGMTDGLAQALRRCLATSPAQRAAMGTSAAQSVRRKCDNAEIVARHMEVRSEVARLGAHRSRAAGRIPPVHGIHGKVSATATQVHGACIVVRTHKLIDAEPVLRSIGEQAAQSTAVVIVCASAASENSPDDMHRLRCQGVELLFPAGSGAELWNAGFDASMLRGIPGYWLFLDALDRLLPHYLAEIERTFAHRPDVGIVSPWTSRGVGAWRLLDAPLSPELAHQLVKNHVTPASAFRAMAVTAPVFRPGFAREHDVWDLANRIMAAGWSVATMPKVLAQRHERKPSLGWPEMTALRAIRAELLNPLRDVVTQTALELVDDFVPLPDERRDTLLSGRALRYLARTMRHPKRAPQMIVRRLRKHLAMNGLGSGLRDGGATS
jgi:glycosyltransferase involved in cell wall biosynthesis